MAASTNPVFLKAKAIPVTDSSRPATVLEVCLAAERIAGQGSVVGAQQIGGLWRIYPATREARSELLVKGLRMRGTVLQLANTNPFLLRNDTGEEKPSTKVFIDNIPISVADSEIEHALLKVGCELRSSIKCERARDVDHKLTRFLTGRRFLFITVPTVPLEKTLKVSIFTAKVYHWEQKLQRKTVVCSKCLEHNHHASECSKDVVCRACRKPGHKQGDSVCQLFLTDQPSRESVNGNEEKDESGRKEKVSENDVRKETPRMESAGVNVEREENESDLQEKKKKKEKKDKAARGRPPARQATLGTSLELRNSARHRSETPKRPRSLEASPEAEGHKQAKRGSGQSDRPTSPDSDRTEDVHR